MKSIWFTFQLERYSIYVDIVYACYYLNVLFFLNFNSFLIYFFYLFHFPLMGSMYIIHVIKACNKDYYYHKFAYFSVSVWLYAISHIHPFRSLCSIPLNICIFLSFCGVPLKHTSIFLSLFAVNAVLAHKCQYPKFLNICGTPKYAYF